MVQDGSLFIGKQKGSILEAKSNCLGHSLQGDCSGLCCCASRPKFVELGALRELAF